MQRKSLKDLPHLIVGIQSNKHEVDCRNCNKEYSLLRGSKSACLAHVANLVVLHDHANHEIITRTHLKLTMSKGITILRHLPFLNQNGKPGYTREYLIPPQ